MLSILRSKSTRPYPYQPLTKPQSSSSSFRYLAFLVLLAILFFIGVTSRVLQARSPPPPVHTSTPSPYAGWEWAFNTSVVYTWVNGSEPAYRQSRKEWGSQGQVGGSRDRDNDDLLYSMRAFAKNTPWHTGTIYLVAPHAPVWLNLTHPRIKFVQQDSIIPDIYNPTFSSNVVEQYLHRIPGLSDRFIQINDDCMTMRTLHPHHFFTQDGGVRLFLEAGEIRPPKEEVSKIWLGSVYRTVNTLVETLGPIEHDWPRFVKHAPFVYYRAILEDLHVRFKSVLDETAVHRFRHAHDVLTPLLHHTTLTQLGASKGLSYATPSPAEVANDYVLLHWGSSLDANAEALDKALEHDPIFVTFNDELGNESTNRKLRLAQNQLRRVYKDFFPTPSEFERRA